MVNDPRAGGAPEPDDQLGHLLDEPTTADLRLKVTDAWRDFARALARALAELPPGSELDLTLDPTASGTGDAVYTVLVRAEAGGALTALAVGNAALPAAYRMDRAAVAHLVALGWAPPGVVGGAREYFGLRGTAAGSGPLAATLCRTLRDVYGAPHPAFLVYEMRAADGSPAPIDQLGTARPAALADGVESDRAEPDAAGAGRAVGSGPGEGHPVVSASADDPLPLAEQVRTVVAAMLKTDPEHLQVDSDGDINIRAGSAMVFVRVRDNPPLVDVFSPVLTEVQPSERLYVKLSELTNRMPIGRLYCASDTVWASIPVFGRSFQPTHLMLAVQVMTGLADELDDRLHGEFGGKRFFGETDKPARPNDGEHRTGMYL
ncbi:MAG TPA: hypothetical protein VNV66_08400 [Pilimelia sp.]|nr:hypothetical protein [Pilimelia sp.]